jgi:hypothetical protein
LHVGRQREDRISLAEEEILHEIENQPRTSTWRLADQLEVSQFVVRPNLKEQGLHPYQIQKVQALKPEHLPFMFHLMLILIITVFLLCCLSLCYILNKLKAIFYHHFTNFIRNS